MKTIKLKCGLVTLVDDDVYKRLVGLELYAHHPKSGGPYAMAGGTPVHLLIMGKRHGFVVDHKDRNPLNNCRSNLRFVTKARDCANRLRRNKSGFPGVHRNGPVWRARLRINGRAVLEKRFNSLEAAALAYRDAYKREHLEEHPFYR